MWPNPQFPADLVKFTEEIFHGKLHCLRSDPRLHMKYSPKKYLPKIHFIFPGFLLVYLSQHPPALLRRKTINEKSSLFNEQRPESDYDTYGEYISQSNFLSIFFIS